MKWVMVFFVLASITSMLEIRKNESSRYPDTKIEQHGHLWDGSEIVVVAHLSKLTKRYSYPEPFMWGGDSYSPVRIFIHAMTAQIGNNTVKVPLSAFSDLGSPVSMTVTPSGDGFVVQIRGGETSLAYEATLWFGRVYILRSRVVHGEFPDQVWRDTTYSFIPPDSPM